MKRMYQRNFGEPNLGAVYMRQRLILSFGALMVLSGVACSRIINRNNVQDRSTPLPASSEMEVHKPTASPTSTQAITVSPTPTAAPPTLNPGNAGDVELRARLTDHVDDVLDIAFSPNGRFLASSSSDGTVLVWNVGTQNVIYTLTGHSGPVQSIAFSSDGDLLASGSDDNTVRIWQMSDGSLNKVVKSGLVGRVLEVAFSPDGTLIAMAGHQCFVELRQTRSGVLRRTLAQPGCVARGHGTVSYWGIEFSPDGTQVITGEGRGCCGGSLQEWQIEEFVSPRLIRGYDLVIRDFDRSPEGNSLAVAFVGDTFFQVLDQQHGRSIQRFEGHKYRVNSVAFVPSGLMVVSGSRDATARIWMTEDGAELVVLESHLEAINAVAVSPDGIWIATGSDDDTIILWGLSS